ncbi:MAG: lytic transglycosylase domain-containing protein [Proteobacteria bacterium]|nr:MAG: lytic transglycosylase domain-containing protein [Pseudomonadota bacterium]
MRTDRLARHLGALIALFLAGSAPADNASSPYRLQTPGAAYQLQPRADWRLPPASEHNPAARARPFSHDIAAAAQAAGIETELLHAVVKVESGYNADAVSPKGAQGLAQVMPATAAQFQRAGTAGSLTAGANYLRHLLDRFDGDLSLTLAAYNAGPGAVERHGGIPPYPETQAYVPRVLAEYHALRAERRRLPTPWQQGSAWQDRAKTQPGS